MSSSPYDSGSLSYYGGVSLTSAGAQDFGVGTATFDLATEIASGNLDFGSTTVTGVSFDTGTAWGQTSVVDTSQIDGTTASADVGGLIDSWGSTYDAIDLSGIDLGDDTVIDSLSDTTFGTVALGPLDFDIDTTTILPVLDAATVTAADAFTADLGTIVVSDLTFALTPAATASTDGAGTGDAFLGGLDDLSLIDLLSPAATDGAGTGDAFLDGLDDLSLIDLLAPATSADEPLFGDAFLDGLADLGALDLGALTGGAGGYASLDLSGLPQEVQDLITSGVLESGGARPKITEPPGNLPSWSLDSYLKARVLANRNQPPIGLETLMLFDPRPGYVNFGNGTQVSIPNLILGLKNVGLLQYVGPEVVVTQPGLVEQLNINPATGERNNPALYEEFESAAAELRGFFPSGGITVLGLGGYHRF